MKPPLQLARCLFGGNVKTRARARLAFCLAGVWAAWGVGNHVLLHFGLMSHLGAAIMDGYCLLGILIFYPLIRSGLSMRYADPGLEIQQMVYLSMGIVLAYPLTPTLRTPLLQCLCLVQVLGLFGLRSRQALQLGWLSTVMLLNLLVVMLTGPSLVNVPELQFTIEHEALRMLMVSLIVLMLGYLSRYFGKVRQTVQAQRQGLAMALVQIRQLATRDSLTGLLTRQRMMELAKRERSRFKRSGIGFSLALIDLDHLKRANVRFGHQLGDEVIVGFAQVARSVLRSTDLIGRWEGQQFLVLMPETEPATLGIAGIERLRDAVSKLPLAASSPKLKITFSAAIAGCTHDEPLEHVLGRAERALRLAKQRGRNRCMLAENPYRIRPPRDLARARKSAPMPGQPQDHNAQAR